MRTLEEAKQATALGQRRDLLIWQARQICTSGSMQFGPAPLPVKTYVEEFRQLVHKEFRAQLEPIDSELRAMGIDPGPIPALEEWPTAERYMVDAEHAET